MNTITIKFGYGNTFVTSNMNILKISITAKSFEIGSTPDPNKRHDIVAEFLILLDYEDIIFLMDKIHKINEQNNILTFKNYIFDFTNYNQKSVNAVIKHIDRIYSYNMMLAAM